MTSRERTLRAMDLHQPDRVPLDVWISAGFRRKLGLDDHDVDLRYIDGPAYVGPPLRTFDGGDDCDIWGVRRTEVTATAAHGVETYREVAHSPLAGAETVEDIEQYRLWPSADWFDYSQIEGQCEHARGRDRAVVFMGDRMNRLAQLKPAMYLRGIDTILIDLALNPDIAKAIFAKIRTFYRAYAERIFEAANGKIDILLTGDDFGSQAAPIVSPAMWTDFLADGFAEYIALAKTHGIRVMHHTCGSVRAFIPHMIDCGLDALQSIQPEAANMNPRELKAEFGDRLAFHGGLSIQQTLPFGTTQDVRAEVRDRIEALASGGGYILCTSHNIQADTPPDNLDALFLAHKDFGSYA